jgi:predicted DNA-binding transcriptional regulator AlpA
MNQTSTNQPGARYLSPARVCDKLSRKKSWLYDRMKNDSSFPQPIRLGAWNVFVESQIDEWVITQAQSAGAVK